MSDSVTELMEPVPGNPSKKPKGDLGVRTLSAIVMVVVAGAAYWLDGWPWMIFLGLVGIGLLWELWGLVRLLTTSAAARSGWMLFGMVYFGLALFMALLLSAPFFGRTPILLVIGAVIATDVGAYFAGRSIGGPKIAPKISPSKTWAGLGGGMVCAALFFVVVHHLLPGSGVGEQFAILAATGAIIAIVAQAGDFFESWMKRRAGVKDSGKLIPGHGGIFDRTDGLIAVLFATGLIFFASTAFAG